MLFRRSEWMRDAERPFSELGKVVLWSRPAGWREHGLYDMAGDDPAGDRSGPGPRIGDGHMGDRDRIDFRGHDLTLIKGQPFREDVSSWRTFLSDRQGTRKGWDSGRCRERAFSNPTITQDRDRRRRNDPGYNDPGYVDVITRRTRALYADGSYRSLSPGRHIRRYARARLGPDAKSHRPAVRDR